jgi:hypothetical protein
MGPSTESAGEAMASPIWIFCRPDSVTNPDRKLVEAPREIDAT